MKTYQKYIKELREQWGFEATWTPDDERSVGDVGVFRRGAFERKGCLKDFGIDVKPRPTAAKSEVYYYRSAGAVDISLGGGATAGPSGGALAGAEGRAVVKFGKKGAILFRAVGCHREVVEDIYTLRRELIRKRRRGDWPKRYAVVTDVIRAKRATILISGADNQTVELRAAADASAAGLDLLTAAGSLGLSASGQLNTEICSRGSLTPLYLAKGIKKWPFQEPDLRYLDPGEDGPQGGVPGDFHLDDVNGDNFDADADDEDSDAEGESSS